MTNGMADGSPPQAPDPIDLLPRSFRWGVATAAYQIEGAVAEDGRTHSIWDTFCRVPGAVSGGHTGDIACDHYHRMPQDVDTMRSLGVDTYRFSIAWPRVQPHGRGNLNERGVGFYDRLVDELLKHGIQPWVTLYHWDLPQELEDEGGWPVRDTAYRFADYATAMFSRLQDRVASWTTLNEPWCSAILGYGEGHHAPGRRDFPAAIRAVHHLLLAHGLATRRMRSEARGPKEFGISLNLSPVAPATGNHPDREAARRVDALNTRMYLDPLLHGRYPDDLIADLAARGAAIPIERDDLTTICAPIDVLGVNYYTGVVVSGTDLTGNTRDPSGSPIDRVLPRNVPRTAMGWDIVPTELTRLLLRLQRDYPAVPIVITENGAAFDDHPDETGFVQDDDRVDYLASHIRAVAEAHASSVDVRGYFAWSLLDNFEWAFGYDRRFGLVRVDYDTQVRTTKQSGLWYRDLIARVRNR